MTGEDAFPEPLEMPLEIAVYFATLWELFAACLAIEWGVAGLAASLWFALLAVGGDAT